LRVVREAQKYRKNMIGKTEKLSDDGRATGNQLEKGLPSNVILV
jgi:hypothetical protein